MPSPFPGMDPYLQSPRLWPGCHNRLADEISSLLNKLLPEGYYADIEMREEIDIVGDIGPKHFVADVSIQREKTLVDSAVATVPRAETSACVELVLETEPVRYANVMIKEADQHAVITSIEILSPANKRPGQDRQAFVTKRDELLAAGVSILEIDLLRNGQRTWDQPVFQQAIENLEPRPQYMVTVSRSWDRGQRSKLAFYPVTLQQTLPVLAVPLRQSDPDVALDLQYCFREAYDSGPYRRGAVDYTKPPEPSLPEPLSDWARRRIEQWRDASS
ncbi:DUF4058 family protein [Stratiformator vulcanicus]|uniref:DUF4058 domain-containing protein n=1 Tax=Stratiformator vulcanicus TaxID=2527980 RepID=A0A517R3Y6_9PLAN|nr:DUF4058 family protein [Stratiformator vulcanicus]QDT38602.1 hypothetical protein Pan189_29970 [Stratiformator vulcanicus]